jgi:hypothetical protein
MLEALHKPNQIAQAVTGLSGLCGLFFVPMILAWLRLAIHWTQARRSALARHARFSGRRFAQCIAWSLIFGFFLFARSRAVAELHEVRVDTQLFTSTLTAISVGVVVWTLLALLGNTIRNDWRRRQGRRQSGSAYR